VTGRSIGNSTVTSLG